ncbi:MAG: AbrB/MazE/SpoVT family DNA-binding domain-containing protein, partial [Gemmatimonadota bacterium]|nr:AbrB/MazE/SpoVT family DNA-binding domain-containing protein [Gemmatimonadota bacterium]
ICKAGDRSLPVMPRRRVRLTTKRQATLPAALCEELGVGPGDELELERCVVDGSPAWVLRAARPDWSWFGAAHPWTAGKSHRWDAIERSLARGWVGDDRA